MNIELDKSTNGTIWVSNGAFLWLNMLYFEKIECWSCENWKVLFPALSPLSSWILSLTAQLEKREREDDLADGSNEFSSSLQIQTQWVKLSYIY